MFQHTATRRWLPFEEFKRGFFRAFLNEQPFSQEFEKIVDGLISEGEENNSFLAEHKNCFPVILFKLFQEDYQPYIKGEKTLTFTSLLTFAENPNLPSHCLDQLTFNEKISKEDRKHLDMSLVKNPSLSKQNLNIIVNRIFNNLTTAQKVSVYKDISKLPVFNKEIEQYLKSKPEVKEIFYPSVDSLMEEVKEVRKVKGLTNER